MKETANSLKVTHDQSLTNTLQEKIVPLKPQVPEV